MYNNLKCLNPYYNGKYSMRYEMDVVGAEQVAS